MPVGPASYVADGVPTSPSVGNIGRRWTSPLGPCLLATFHRKLHRTIRQFLDEHRDEAYAAWDATRCGEPPDRIQS